MASINESIDLNIYIIDHFFILCDFFRIENIGIPVILINILLFLFTLVGGAYSNIASFQPGIQLSPKGTHSREGVESTK